MCDPTTKMCVPDDNRTTMDTPQISFSGAAAAETTSGSGASEAQPISMSRWLEKFGGGPRRGSVSGSLGTCNTQMGGLTPPSYDVGVGGDHSRDGTPGPAGVGGIAAKMFSGLGEYINFGASGHHQMNTPSQHDHDMMFGAAVMVSSSTHPPPPESSQSNVEEYSTVARFLADEETATARDGMEVERGARKMPSMGEASDISERVTRLIPMENFPVATNESLESLQELSTMKRAARESSGETDHLFSLDMDVIPEEGEGDSSRKSSREEQQRQQQQGNFKIAEKLLSSKATQNWFFQNSQSNTEAAAAEVEVVEAAARKAKEFHLWSPQTM